MMMMKIRDEKKGGVEVTPISGNLIVAGVIVIVLVAIYFLVTGQGIPDIDLGTGTGTGGPTGETTIKSEAEVGEAMIDVGSDVQALTGFLKELDDKIA